MTQVVIGGSIYLLTPSDLLIKALRKELTYSNPEYVKAKQLGLSLYGKPKTICLVGRTASGITTLPIGCLQTIVELEERLNIPIEYVDRTSKGVTHPTRVSQAITLRDYQENMIAEAVAKDRGIIVAPAGSGKTVTGMGLISAIGRKTLWLTHTKELMLQSANAVEKVLGVKAGILGGGRVRNLESPVVVATVQTLSRRPHLISELGKQCGVCIVDEAHLASASTFTNLLHKLPIKRKYGLTATPHRKDGKSYLFHAYIGETLVETDRGILYEEGKLLIPDIRPIYSEYRGTNAISVEGDTIDLGGEEGNYNQLVNELLSDSQRVDLIVKAIEDLPMDKPTLIIGDRIEYLEKIKQAYFESQFKVIPTLFGSHSNEVRETILEDVKAGRQNKLIATTQLVKEGLDIPNLCHLVIATPMAGDKNGQDGTSLEQAVGRIMRVDPSDPTKRPLIVDVVDYHNETFKRQWYSRRKVYKRLGIAIPSKPRKSMTEELADIIF